MNIEDEEIRENVLYEFSQNQLLERMNEWKWEWIV